MRNFCCLKQKFKQVYGIWSQNPRWTKKMSNIFPSFHLFFFLMNREDSEFQRSINLPVCEPVHTVLRIGHQMSASNRNFSHASKVMLKILQARLQQYMNQELPDVQAGFRKGRGTRDQIANIHWIIEKARVPEKHLLLLH